MAAARREAAGGGQGASGPTGEALSGRIVAALLAASALLAGAGAGAGASASGSAAATATAAVKPPNDPLFPRQWHLPAIQIPAAWAVSRGAGATVAVLDTGVAYERRGPYRRAPDLAGTRFVPGYDFVDDDSHPNDVRGPNGRRSHGTLMAGIIAQTTGNGIGGAGVAPRAAIMPVRVLNPDLTGTGRDIARGIRFAADHGADVVNLSISGTLPQPAAVTRALRYAAAKGVTLVAAAGNNGQPSIGWPAADPRVIAVGAVSRDLQRAPYSDYGPALDIVAPGGAGTAIDIGEGPQDGVLAQTLHGTLRDFCFCSSTSTSAAAAQVSGVAALLVGSRRAARPGPVRRALTAGASDLGPRGPDREFGAGLLQARSALAAAGSAQGRSADPGSSGLPAVAVAAAVLAIAGAGLAVVLSRRRRAPA